MQKKWGVGGWEVDIWNQMKIEFYDSLRWMYVCVLVELKENGK